MRIDGDGIRKAQGVEIILRFCSKGCVGDKSVRVAHLRGQVDYVSRVVIPGQHGAEVASPRRVCVHNKGQASGLKLLAQGQDGAQGVYGALFIPHIVSVLGAELIAVASGSHTLGRTNDGDDREDRLLGFQVCLQLLLELIYIDTGSIIDRDSNYIVRSDSCDGCFGASSAHLA